MFRNIVTGVVLAACVAPAFAAVEWMTDMEAAKAKAAAEKKAILVDFTGSDWCGWCIRIRKEIFDKPRFEEYIKDKFVPVEIDLPHNPKFDPELRKRNEALSEQYAVEGFPTIMVTDARGVVTGGFVGGVLDPVKVEGILDAGYANAGKLDAAQALQGEAKAKALAEVYQSLPEELKRAADPMFKEILALDPNDTTGMGQVMKARQQMEELMQKLEASKNPAELRRVVEEGLAAAYPENRPMVLQLKCQVLLALAESEADIIAVRDALLELAGDDAARRAHVERNFADPAAVLKLIQQQRPAKK